MEVNNPADIIPLHGHKNCGPVLCCRDLHVWDPFPGGKFSQYKVPTSSWTGNVWKTKKNSNLTSSSESTMCCLTTADFVNQSGIKIWTSAFCLIIKDTKLGCYWRQNVYFYLVIWAMCSSSCLRGKESVLFLLNQRL